jgi:hypothetical protein
MRTAIEAMTARGFLVKFAYDSEHPDDNPYCVQIVHYMGTEGVFVARAPDFHTALLRCLNHVIDIDWEKD